jgi:hypothetical protein
MPYSIYIPLQKVFTSVRFIIRLMEGFFAGFFSILSSLNELQNIETA